MKVNLKIIIPLLVGIIFFAFLNWKKTTLYDDLESEQTNIIVAKVNLPKGSVLTLDDLGMKSIPVKHKLETMVEPTKINSVKGKKLKTDIQSDQPILTTEIE